MIEDFVEEASTRAGSRYAAFLTALRGVLAEYLVADPRDQRAFAAIRSGGEQTAQTFLESELEHFRNDLFGVQGIAAADTPWGDTGEEMSAWFWQEIGAQVWRDINALAAARRQVVAHAQAKSFRGGDIGAIFQKLVEQGRGSPQFSFTDRIGRRYASETYARQLYRHGLVMHGVSEFAALAAAQGAQEAFVTHPEPDHRHAGMRVSLVGDEGVALADIIAEVFHPNSRAFLKVGP